MEIGSELHQLKERTRPSKVSPSVMKATYFIKISWILIWCNASFTSKLIVTCPAIASVGNYAIVWYLGVPSNAMAIELANINSRAVTHVLIWDEE